MITSRLCRVQLVGLLVALGILVMGVNPAHSLTVEQTCTGTEVTSYDPPLTFTPRLVTVTVNGLFPICTDDEAIHGSYSTTFTTTASCLTLWDSGSATETLVWGGSGVTPSTFAFNVTATAVGGQVIVTNAGLITGGQFAPASAEQVVVLATPNILQCATTGISNVTGSTTLTIYRP